MDQTCLGWRIVCPDGRVRHFPYHREEDAEFDSNGYTANAMCRSYSDDPPEWSSPPCPQGKHTVLMITFDHE